MKSAGFKKFKDPIYGYVEVEEEIVKGILDTAVFQRLRDIIQTSYAPLYTSALHNRFVHSIGVYHLGKIAEKVLLENSREIIEGLPDYMKYLEVFERACLLHDVGHAPFSHTGETFYLQEETHDFLHKSIIDLVEDPNLKDEISKNSYKAAPHELMSVIVALKAFGSMIEKNKWSFFARCITGYKYTEDMDPQKQLLNCLIDLLNSSVIDVDKLDYLIRDSHMSGFDTIKIDYIRLLESMRIVRKENVYHICYYKSAVSVIENVVYAHDAQRKWIQNHPTVIYEAYLLKKMLSQIFNKYMGSNYLAYDYLTKEGKETGIIGRIRLMSDSDAVFLMKNLEEKEDYVEEYFDRRFRRHPIWKTEAEYQAIFSGNENAADIIEQEFSDLIKNLDSMGISGIIDKHALETCRNDAQDIKETLEKGESEQPEQDKEALEKRLHQIEIIEALQRFAEKQEPKIDFEFVIISADQFNSGFRKPEFSKIDMIFPELNSPCSFGEVSNVLKASESKGKKFFYLYYKRKNEEKGLLISELIKDWISIAYRIDSERKARKAAEKLK